MLCRHCLSKRVHRFCPAFEQITEGRVVLKLQLIDAERMPHSACIAVTAARLRQLFTAEHESDFVNIVEQGELLYIRPGLSDAPVHHPHITLEATPVSHMH